MIFYFNHPNFTLAIFAEEILIKCVCSVLKKDIKSTKNNNHFVERFYKTSLQNDYTEYFEISLMLLL